MKLVKYFLQKRAVTILLLVLVLAGGLLWFIICTKMHFLILKWESWRMLPLLSNKHWY